MIYTAPRQVLFAVIIVTSFFLHSVLMVSSTAAQITESREQKASRIVTDLIDEAAVSMSYTDRVSLSVIAKKYAGEYDVTRLIILDNNEDILVQTGDSPMQDGNTIKEIATYKDAVVGSVLLTMKMTNKSEIVKDLWVFIVLSFFGHLIIWMLYSLVARPTKRQIKMLSNDIHEHYFSHYHAESLQNQSNELLSYGPETHDTDKVMIQSVSLAEAKQTDDEKVQSTKKSKFNIQRNKKDKQKPANKIVSFINNKLGRKNKTELTEEPSTKTLTTELSAHTDGLDDDNIKLDVQVPTKNTLNKDITSFIAQSNAEVKINNELTKDPIMIPEDDIQSSQKLSKMSQGTHGLNTAKLNIVESRQSNLHMSHTAPTDYRKDNTASLLETQLASTVTPDTGITTNDSPINEVIISIRFVDPYGLIDKLSDELSIPYYKLCTQLLNQACQELFKQDFLQGVTITKNSAFTDKGANIRLHCADESKLILAAPVLAELYQILNSILYEKHRELGRFSLPVAIGVSIPENKDSLSKFIDNNTEAQDIVLLLPKSKLVCLKDTMSFSSISQPRSVLERECVYVDEVDISIQKTLFKVRNTVLKGKQPKA